MNMEKERENIDILRTPSRIPLYVCVCVTPGAILQYSPDVELLPPACWYCQFFEPDGSADLSKPWTDDLLPGECRRHPPQIGDLINRDTHEEERLFGDFPRVMAGDWCGEFQHRDASAKVAG